MGRDCGREGRGEETGGEERAEGKRQGGGGEARVEETNSDILISRKTVSAKNVEIIVYFFAIEFILNSGTRKSDGSRENQRDFPNTLANLTIKSVKVK